MGKPEQYNKYNKLCDAIVRNDKVETRRLLLANAAEILSANKTNLLEDIEAIMKCVEMTEEEKKIKLSLSSIKNFSARTLKYCLDIAVAKGNIYVVKYIIPYYKLKKLIDNEIIKDYVHTDGRISNECVEVALQYGYNLDSEGRNDGPFIYLAIKNGHLAILKDLMARKINLNVVNHYTGLTPLHIAELNQHQEIIDLLIKNGVDKQYGVIEQKWFDMTEVTPLCSAVINSDIDLIKLILENEARTYADINLITYIKIAMQKENSMMIELLLNHLRDIDSLDSRGQSLLQTCIYNDFEFYYLDVKQKMSEVLLKKGADVNIKDNSGNSLIFEAIRYRNSTLLKTLLKNKATVNELNDCGNTALHLACYRNNFEMVKILLSYKARVDVENRYGTTPLHLACKNRNEDIIKILLKYKADPNIGDFNGGTPLLTVCNRIRYNYNDTLLSIIKMLLDHGACLDASDDKGRNSLIATCEVENIAVSDVVFDHRFSYLLEE